jgi:TusA-related sulfurtransferase
MSESAVVTIDVSGRPCPAPLLGAKKILDTLQPGQTMCLVSDCPGAHDDLAAWCQQTGHILVSHTKQSAGKVAYRLGKQGEIRTLPEPNVTLDLRGVACPGPILEARKLLDGMRTGEVLRLVTDCTAAMDDVPLWTRTSSVELLHSQEVADGAWQFFLRTQKIH